MKIAFGKALITPDNYVGMPLAGYTRKDVCRGKLDDIFVHGVLIEEGYLGNLVKRILLISTDLLKLSMLFNNYVKERIFEKYRISPGQILIHATHTHAAPDLTGEFTYPGGVLNTVRGILFGKPADKYFIEIAGKIEKLVGELIENLVPCKMAWAKEKIEEDLIINRRHPTRRSKFDLGVISFKGLENGKLLGMIVNYAAHGTTLSNENLKLSADYIGRMVHRIEELTNNETKAVYFNGPSGDINPITTCGSDFDEMEKDYSHIYEQKGTYEDTIRLGYFLGERSIKLANSIKDSQYVNTLNVKVYQKIFSIPMKDINASFNFQFLLNKLLYWVKRYFLLPILLAKPKPNFPSISLKKKRNKINIYTMIQIFEINTKKGTFYITGVPGELFEDIGKKILDVTPTGKENQFIFQNTNDWVGYLFPLKEYTRGGYEILPTFSPLGGEYIQKEALKFYEEIKNNANFHHF
ncbi:MAG: hypothetical protein HWN65_08050 [Candidatus Helarchaeota archaeon]|nr:hypothetical protein [Candidatus Helarchaeota archaeon]